MHDIDFLPSEYRRDYARRKWSHRRILVATLLAAMITAAGWHQQYRGRRLQAELAGCEPARAAAVQTQESLNELQARLQVMRASADLVTYLRHPWPRTRILAAILRPLPDEIVFERLQIDREPRIGPKSGGGLSPANKKPNEEPSASLPPAAQDLEQLREEFDSRPTVVTITGVTTESSALHQYLGELGREALISRAELHSIEADEADPKRIRFSATLVVRPGYGQRGGPPGPNPQAAGRTGQKTT